MSGKTPTEVMVAVHFDREGSTSVRVSIDGVDANGKWVHRPRIKSFHLTGQTTIGKDRYGNAVRVPMARLVIEEWLAKRLEFI